MDLNDIYTDIIYEHNTSKKNKRKLDNPDTTKKGHNPSCGDEIELSIKQDGDIIVDLAFTGQGCAISQASTSVMCDIVKGKSKSEALKIMDTFINMIKSEYENEEELEVLEDAIAFKNISKMPGRVKCAVLCWHTLKECM